MSSSRLSLGGAVFTARRALWHLRHGGVKQLRTFQQRRRTEAVFGGAAFRSSRVEQRAAVPAAWNKKAFGAVPAMQLSEKTKCGYTLDFLPLEFPTYEPTFSDVTVAVILDDFSLTAWSYEFNTVVVTPDNWRETLESTPVDFLLVESAWAGNHKAWQYHLTGVTAPRPAVIELLDYTKQHNIPSVFWNKEDPPHFHDFLYTAKLFDFVFTSDSTMVPEYKKALNHENVFPLSFAAQTAVHNPIRPAHGVQKRGAAFAGTYFAHKYPERREQMNVILSGAQRAAKKNEESFEIFSRFIDEDEKYQFPSPFDEHVVGSLSYHKMLTAYKAYKTFLNVNSVVGSPTMCARRIFEILASGTPVVTTGSEAIPRFFTPDQIAVADTEEDAYHLVRALLNSKELRDRMVHNAQRTIWGEHTYTHRAQLILDTVGVKSQELGTTLPSVSAISSTNRPGQLEHLFAQAGKQARTLKRHGVDFELLVLTHGFSADEDSLRQLADKEEIEHFTLLQGSTSQSLGECLNVLVQASSHDVISKFDDDDLYGEFYLLDALYAMKFSRADIVGKQAHHMYLADSDQTLLRFPEREHRFTGFVMGPTITGKREVFESIPFSAVGRGEDSDFLARAVEAGKRIYSTDRFNFVQVRSQGAGQHTWNLSHSEALSSGKLLYFGLNTQHVMF